MDFATIHLSCQARKALSSRGAGSARRCSWCAVSLLAEASSFLALWWLEGRPGAAAALQGRRLRLQAQAAEEETPAAPHAVPPAPIPAGEGPPSAVDLLADPAHLRRALHPYLGFVYDPAVNASPRRRAAGYPPISPHGFYARPGAAPGPGQVDVALFGGSMAMLAALEGGAALESVLAAAPAFAGRPVAVRCYALGGYKQPQQLAALAYLLALGEDVDFAVNLDGLNEVSLARAENVPKGVFPFYPRSWDALVQAAVNPAALRQAGLVAHLQQERARRAAAFSGPLARRLSTANLLWLSLDRRLERRLAAEQAELARLPLAPRGFAAQGPPWTAAGDDALFPELAAHWARSSRLMAGLAAARGVRYYHFLQPNQYDPGAKPMGFAETAAAVDAATPFAEPVRRAYPLLSRAGEELRRAGVSFVDLRRVFAGHPEPLYIDKCCHVSRRGSEILMRAIGQAIAADLARRGPVPGNGSGD